MANAHWSWMFSDESSTIMAQLGWTWPGLGSAQTTYLYSYPNDPQRAAGKRYSILLYSGYLLVGIPGKAPSSGSMSAPVYFSATPNTNDVLYVTSNGGTNISVRPVSSTSLGLYMNNTLKETVTGLTLQSSWNYITLKYDMTANPWSARLYVNESGSGTTFTDSRAADVCSNFTFKGAASAYGTYFGQVAFHSDWQNTEKIRYVTRINPSADSPSSGTWAPSAGSDNFAMVSGTFGSTKYVENTGSSIGENIIFKVSGASGLVTQLGTSPSAIDGITAHCWVSGSGQNGFAAVSNNSSSWANGSSITPSSQATYGYATAATQPSDSGAWTSGSTLYIKYEVG